MIDLRLVVVGVLFFFIFLEVRSLRKRKSEVTM